MPWLRFQRWTFSDKIPSSLFESRSVARSTYHCPQRHLPTGGRVQDCSHSIDNYPYNPHWALFRVPQSLDMITRTCGSYNYRQKANPLLTFCLCGWYQSLKIHPVSCLWNRGWTGDVVVVVVWVEAPTTGEKQWIAQWVNYCWLEALQFFALPFAQQSFKIVFVSLGCGLFIHWIKFEQCIDHNLFRSCQGHAPLGTVMDTPGC